MSSGSAVESTVSADGSGTVHSNSAAGSGGGAGVLSGSSKCSGNNSQTPRFTQDEKEILYTLFHQHEEVIDIKYRKKQRNKFAVRDAWEQIVREFNSHPSVNAMRNVKQVQKFWLNARLRKQYPFRGNNSKSNANANNSNRNDHSDQTIKHEPELQINENDASGQADGEEFEEIEMDSSVVHEVDDDDPIDTEHHQQQQQQQQIQQTNTIQTQQISVDQISAEKLTLNDLLQFKTTRPREEIILQIKHPADGTGPAQITLPSPTRISIPTHQQTHQHATMATITATGYNQQIISEIKPQQITLAQYQAQQQQQIQQQQQQQLAQQQLAAAAVAAVQQQQQQQQQQQHHHHQNQQQHQQNQQLKMQIQQAPTATGNVQYANGTPTFTCTTYNAVPVVTASGQSIAPSVVSTATTTPPAIINPNNITMNNLGGVITTTNNDSFEEKLNYFKLKEAEIRVKEEQVALEKKKIELNRAQEELKHMREMYRLQVEEMKTKIRILQEEEKNLRKNHINLPQSP